VATLKLSIHLHHVPGLVSLSTYVYYVYGLMDARFLSYSRHDVPTLVCYKRPHSGADHGSSTGFDSRVVPVELPSCSPKQLRTFTLRPILNEQFTRCRAIWGTLWYVVRPWICVLVLTSRSAVRWRTITFRSILRRIPNDSLRLFLGTSTRRTFEDKSRNGALGIQIRIPSSSRPPFAHCRESLRQTVEIWDCALSKAV
jgi:hypothetical protein